MNGIELHYLGLDDLARELTRKSISSAELTAHQLDRLENISRVHKCCRELARKSALEAAKASDERRAKGKTLGPLDGIPFGVKDLIASKGIPTRWGSPGHVDQIFDYDATALARLKAAGAVLIGKLAMIELAGGGDYDYPWASDMGATLSAWDKSLWAGGSSSGTGASVGLGCVPFGLGSETSGSILCPSAFNGVTGLRPTYGLVSRFGAMALSWTLDKVGPMARSAKDCQTVLSVIAGYDPKDPTTAKEKVSLKHRGKKPRVGIMKEAFESSKADACAKGYLQVVDTLKKQGYEVVDVSLPKNLPNAGMIVGLIVDGEGASAHENFIRSEKVKLLADHHQTAGFMTGLTQPTVDYLWAMRARTELQRANEIWDSCDVIFRPVFYHKALPADKPFSETWRNMGDTGISLCNALGWPAIAFPIAFEEGAPIGGQFIGPCFGEAAIIQAALDFQKESDLHLRRPPEPMIPLIRD